VTNDLGRRAEPIADVRHEPSPVSTWQIIKWWLSEIWRARRPKAGLKILGIEVTQAVQHFSLTEPSLNNTVPLVARKRTMVRVYVDSGIPAGVDDRPPPARPDDYTPPPPAVLGQVPNVTGTLKLSAAGIGGQIGEVIGPGGRVEAASSVRPINPGEVMTARPPDQIDRRALTHTLNFSLPVALSGQIRLQVEVHLKGSILGLLFRARASTVVEFHERRLPEKFVHVLVNHPAAPAPASMYYYYACLDRVIAMYPAPDADFFPLYHLPEFESIEFEGDLHTEEGWDELLRKLGELKERFKLDGFVLTALFPPTLASPWAVGVPFYVQPEPPLAYAGRGEFAVVFSDPDVFAHELGHHFGLGHAGQGNPKVQGDEDPRIPSTLTDEAGIDMSKHALVPAGSIEIMCYMTGSPSWFSTTTWQILFDQFAP
jgi:hypothetical protein